MKTPGKKQYTFIAPKAILFTFTTTLSEINGGHPKLLAFAGAGWDREKG